MFNGHMDTSYSGREPWLRDVPGFQPQAFERRRAAVRARHLEHEGRARLLRRGRACAAGRGRATARRRVDRGGLRRDREDAVRRRDRAGSTAAMRPARAISSRTAASPTCACSASRPKGRSCSATSVRSGCASGCTATSSTRPSARASATRTRSCACTRCSRPCRSGSRTWENDPSNAYRGAKAIVNVGAIEGGFGWRVSRTPHHCDLFLDVRVPPTKAMGVARREVLDVVRALAERFPDYGIEGEVYVTAPGAEIDEGHELVQAVDEAHDAGLRLASRSATSRAGSATRRRCRATASRPSTTGRRRA